MERVERREKGTIRERVRREVGRRRRDEAGEVRGTMELRGKECGGRRRDYGRLERGIGLQKKGRGQGKGGVRREVGRGRGAGMLGRGLSKGVRSEVGRKAG